MSRYFSYEEDEAYKEGRRDEQNGRHNWEYDSWSSDRRDRAYFDGIEDEKRAERIREEERQMEEEQIRREEERRAYERRREEEQMEYEYIERLEEEYRLEKEYAEQQKELFFQQEKEMQAHFEYLYDIDMMLEDVKDVMFAIMEA